MLLLEGLAALAAKIASASTVAQATAGLGIAVAGVTGAGAAGVLPGPLQDGVATTVEAVTPFDLPRSVDDRITGIDDRHETRSADDVDPPSTVPTSVPVSRTTTAHVEHETEDHGVEDGTHQHRGGRTEAVPTPATVTSAPRTTDDHVETHSPETEDHHGGDDSGHGGDDSGSDDSGHGGGDDH
jgi:hypothetical protein